MGDPIPPLVHLATVSPPASSRAWQSSPHPTLPILATATSERAVNIYSLTSFRLLNRVSGGHKRSVRSVAWRRPLARSADGRKGAAVLATGSFDATVGIWRREIDDDPPGHTRRGDDEGAMHDSEFEAEIDDRLPVKADVDDEEAWQFAVLLTGHDSEVKAVAFSPSNPSLLATCSRDKSVWIWEEVSGGGGGGMDEDDEYETIAVLTEHSGDVKCLSWNWDSDVLASGSYDDTIRLWREVEEEGDWMCVGCIDGHDGTIWSVQWEKSPTGEDAKWRLPNGLTLSYADDWEQWANTRGARLASSSDDLTIRIWRRDRRSGHPLPDERGELKKNKIPSIIKPASTTEEWIQDAILPATHVRSVYSIAWSERTGRIVSCGGDGSIYVYEEFSAALDSPAAGTGPAKEPDAMMIDSNSSPDAMTTVLPAHLQTIWKVIYSISAAHGDYEINHVCWALRRDRGRKRTEELGAVGAGRLNDDDNADDEEEVIITTGDDGEVKIWTLE